MTPEEIKELTRPIAIKARQAALDNGAWCSYKNDLCVDADMFIHEFKDGHKELVRLGSKPGDYVILKVF